jgi:hypothetical protein
MIIIMGGFNAKLGNKEYLQPVAGSRPANNT